MSNHASFYCKTLDNVSKAELVNALHQALMQLNAMTKEARELGSASFLDNKPAIAEASRVLAKAGHVGFPNPAKGDWHFEHSSGGSNGLAYWRKTRKRPRHTRWHSVPANIRDGVSMPDH